MSATTAAPPTRVTRRTTTVREEETPATQKPESGFMNWLRRMGESIRRGWDKFWDGVKRAASWTKEKTTAAAKAVASGARRGGSSLWRGIKWVGNKIYWSGAAVGRFIGRGARFFGRSTLTLARGTGRFLGRTSGWVLRTVSWSVREGLEAMFVVSLAGWLLVGGLVTFLAWSHDSYEQNIHRHAKAASRGEYRADDPGSFGAAEAKKAFSSAADIQAARVAHWDDTHTVVIEEVVPVFNWDDIDKLAFWSIRDPALPLPEGVDFDLISETMMDAVEYGKTPVPGSKKEYLITNEAPEAQKLTDNEIWLGNSYWSGRKDATMTFHSATADINMLKPWKDIEAQIRNAMGTAWTQIDKNLQTLYDNRTYHQNTVRKGWQHQTTYLIGWFEQMRKRTLSAQELEEAERPKPTPPKKTAAKKQTAKKTTGSV